MTAPAIPEALTPVEADPLPRAPRPCRTHRYVTAFRGELQRQHSLGATASPAYRPPEFPAHGWSTPRVSSPDMELMERILNGLRRL
ncbi:hypothetical protein SAMN04487904_103309 [Actinopolyspora lacussalsi subsp. righensis]|uniref:Uncharacterized protein n=1 Tax=Actinopolyspora righensis TaxID=995060 RepID=A0A1I6YWH7_9ACTN|nr:hypothetical protein SAMN04487904_103309 [Actinopolyspora righensis]